MSSHLQHLGRILIALNLSVFVFMALLFLDALSTDRYSLRKRLRDALKAAKGSQKFQKHVDEDDGAVELTDIYGRHSNVEGVNPTHQRGGIYEDGAGATRGRGAEGGGFSAAPAPGHGAPEAPSHRMALFSFCSSQCAAAR